MEHNKFYLISIILLISVYESSPDVHRNTRKCSTLPIVEKASLKCIFSGFQRCYTKCLACHVFQSNHQRSKMALTCRNGNWWPKGSKCVLSDACKIKHVGAAEVKCKATTSSYRCHITCTSTKRSKTSGTYVYNAKTRTWSPNLPRCARPKKTTSPPEENKVMEMPGTTLNSEKAEFLFSSFLFNLVPNLSRFAKPESYSLNYETEESNRHPIKQQILLEKYSLWDKSNQIGKLKNRHPMKKQIIYEKYEKKQMKSIAEDIAKKILPDKYGKIGETNMLKSIHVMKVQVLPDKAGGTQKLSDKYGKDRMKSIAEDFAKKILPEKYGNTQEAEETDKLKNIYVMKVQVLPDKAGGTQKLSDKYAKERMKDIAEDIAKKILQGKYGKTRETDRLKSINLMKIQLLPDKAGGTQKLSDKYGKERMKSIAEDFAKKILPEKYGKTKETDIYLMKIQVLHDKAGGTQNLSDKYGKERMKEIAEDIAKKILPG